MAARLLLSEQDAACLDISPRHPNNCDKRYQRHRFARWRVPRHHLQDRSTQNHHQQRLAENFKYQHENPKIRIEIICI